MPSLQEMPPQMQKVPWKKVQKMPQMHEKMFWQMGQSLKEMVCQKEQVDQTQLEGHEERHGTI
jgi:hypothetical protein